MNGHGFITSVCHRLVTFLSKFLKQVGSQLILLDKEDLQTLDLKKGTKKSLRLGFMWFSDKGLPFKNRKVGSEEFEVALHNHV